MFSERQLLDAWQTGKSRGHHFRLTAECVTAFEYRGRQFGHPSTYAAIEIVGAPAMDFILESAAIYPASISEDCAQELLSAVGRAAVDELFAASWDPYRGCHLTVRTVGWDDITSSEVAIYRAARGALSKLRQEGQWTLTM